MDWTVDAGRPNVRVDRARWAAASARFAAAPGVRVVTPSVPPSPLHRIQRCAGNRATQRALQPAATAPPMPALAADARESGERDGWTAPDGVSVSRAGDDDEREARHLGRFVLDGVPPAPVTPQVDAASITRATGLTTGAASHPMSGLGSGEALPVATREMLRPRLGVDLGDVRVHTGPDADHNARA